MFNVDDPQQIIVHNVSIHNHPSNVEVVQRHCLVQQIHDQIGQNPVRRIHQIYRVVLVNAAAVAAAQNQEPVNLQYGSIRSQLNRVCTMQCYQEDLEL